MPQRTSRQTKPSNDDWNIKSDDKLMKTWVLRHKGNKWKVTVKIPTWSFLSYPCCVVFVTILSTYCRLDWCWDASYSDFSLQESWSQVCKGFTGSNVTKINVWFFKNMYVYLCESVLFFMALFQFTGLSWTLDHCSTLILSFFSHSVGDLLLCSGSLACVKVLWVL